MIFSLQSTDPIGGKNFSQKCQNAPYRVGHPIGGTFSKKNLFFFNIDEKACFHGPVTNSFLIFFIFIGARLSNLASFALRKNMHFKVLVQRRTYPNSSTNAKSNLYKNKKVSIFKKFKKCPLRPKNVSRFQFLTKNH